MSATPRTDAAKFFAEPAAADDYSPECVNVELARELETELQAARELLAHYRRFVGKLAVNPNKASAWYTAKAWAPTTLWQSIGHDLGTPDEQKAFLFD